MPKTAVLVAFDVKAGKMEDFLRIIREHAAKTMETERGCEQFDVMTPKDGSNKVHLCEIYADDAAFEEHSGTQRLAEVRERYKDLIEGRAVTVCDL